jgi:uncharacterized protein (PEP-CTERM system associated)
MIKPHFYVAKVSVIALACFALASDVLAGEWVAKSALSVGETYTDNVELEENGEDSKLITTVSPSFNIKGTGNRANVRALAAFQFHNAGGDSDSFSPRISANADAELIKDFLFIDADLFANQSLIDPLAAAGNSSINQADNVTTTYDYTISPYIVRHLGQTADFQLRYTYDDQINKGDELSDSLKESILGTLQSGKDFSRLSWTLTGDYQETSYDDDDSMGENADNEQLTASIKLGYQLFRRLNVNGTIGQEWNSFEPADGDDPDDKFWDIGFLWNPTQRTSFDFGYGKHFFSTTPRFKFSHKMRKLTFESSYSRSLTDTRSERANTNPFGLTDEQVEEFEEDVPGFEQFLTDNFTFQDQGIFVSERFDNSLSLKGKRTTAALYLKESKQIREDIDDDSIFTSMGMRMERELSSKNTLTSRLSWDEREEGSGDKSDTMRFYLSLKRKIGTRTSVTLAYSLADRDSDRIDDDYKENRLSLTFSIDL